MNVNLKSPKKYFLLALVVLTTPLSKSSAQRFYEKNLFESKTRAQIIEAARTYVGRPYSWDKSGPDAFDCSGFVYYIFKKILGHEKFPLSYNLNSVKGFKHQSLYYRHELKKSAAKIDCAKAQAADVVFFPKSRPRENNHIGIITNPRDQYFITAQSKKSGVAEHGYMESSYWGSRNPECYQNIWIKK